MARKIQVKRGNQSDLPTLAVGELGFTVDENRTYIGSQSGNVELANKSEVMSQLADIAKLSLNVLNPKNGLLKMVPDDPSVDNIPRLNAMIDYLHARNGGSIVFPMHGTFYVAPSKTNEIILKDNVTLYSFGDAVIKVKDDAGDFDTLFNVSDTNRAKILGLTVDMNEQNNSTATQIGFTPAVNLHDTIRGFRADRLQVRGCKVLNSAGVNTITNDAVGIGKRNIIVDNEIHFIRGLNSSWYDNTCIRISRCPYSKVNDNFIYADDLATDAECAIDVESEQCEVKDNKVVNFNNMVDIVNSSLADEAHGITVSGNTGEGILSAFNVWLNGSEDLKDILIRDNIVNITQKQWNKSGRGVYFIEVSDALKKAENVKILDNTFNFEDDDRTGDMGEGINVGGDYKKIGIEIKGNTVKNAPNFAVNVGNGSSGTPRPIIGLDVSGNHFINCSKSPNANGQIVLYKGDLINANIEDNYFYDDGATPYAKFLWGSQVTSNYDGIKIRNNKVYCKNGKLGKDPVPFFAYRELYDLDRKVHAQLNTNNYLNAYPNDVVILDSGIHKVTAYGTYGTLAGVTGSIVAGSRDLVVNDASNIHTWDKITIGGVLDTYVVYVRGNTVRVNDAAPSSVTNGAVNRIAPATTLINS